MKTHFLSDQQRRRLSDWVKNTSDFNAKEIRHAQIILMSDQRAPIEQIMLITGYSRRRIFQIKAAFLAKGEAALIDQRKPEPKRLLTNAQKEEICEILIQHTPLDYKYDTEFWTTAILAEVIEALYGVRYASKTSYYLLFKDAKFSYHKPGRVYERQNPEMRSAWKERTEKIVKTAWNESDTVILAADEMVLSTQTTFQKIWLPQGNYPKIEVSNTKQNRSLYGFLNIKSGKEHVYKAPKQNMHETVKCLGKIEKIYRGKKILLIWDGAGWHKGSKVQEFIDKAGNIEVLYFPPYSPEENPQEHVWKAGRAAITHNRFIEDIDAATDEFVQHLRRTQFPYSLLGFSAIT